MKRAAAPLSLLILTAALSLPACDNHADRAAPPLLVFGRSGIGPLEFNYPRACALDGDERLYVVDKAARVQAFALDGTYLLGWRMPAYDAGKPTGIGIGPDGRVYLADTHYSRVAIYAPGGELLELFGSYGDGPGQFRLPTDVAVASDGSIYVSEYGGNDRISRFSPQLEFLGAFGQPDEHDRGLRRPQTLVIAPDGTLWVADAGNHRVCRYDAEGRLLRTFGAVGGGLGELRFPYGLDCLSDGTLVVCEYGNNRVQRFTPDGRSLGVWGGPGRDPGQLAFPWALSVASDDRVFIIDSGNNRVQVIDGAAPATWSSPPPTPRADRR